MTEIAISVQNISKCYQIYDAPKDRLKQMLVPRLQRMIGKQPKQYFREFQALNDVSFEIKKGETVGIIGHNGSGKSTLLQMICGTLTPTHGSVQANGRIAALLELGSGFNPEFTGRENVYMNAVILGLSKKEVDARFDDIVSFADIGRFIDQPVKTYSSGMYVRLAFAVIVHVDADILVIDEALAVGDAVFTQKCMRFLRRFMEAGTVLFVSHDVGAIKSLCQKAVWLSNGVMQMYSDAEEVSNAYVQHCNQEENVAEVKLTRSNKSKGKEKGIEKDKVRKDGSKVTFFTDMMNSDGWSSGKADIVGIKILSSEGQPIKFIEGGEQVQVKVYAQIHELLLSPIIGFSVKDRLGQPLFGDNTFTEGGNSGVVHAGETLEATFIFTLPLLPSGEYSVLVAIADGDLEQHVHHHFLHDAVILNVQSPKQRFGLVGIKFDEVSLNTVSKY